MATQLWNVTFIGEHGEQTMTSMADPSWTEEQVVAWIESMPWDTRKVIKAVKTDKFLPIKGVSRYPS
jgi:hypothetical protein